VAVRDKAKIPSNKLFEMEQCFFLINFVVENGDEAIELDEDDGEDPRNNNEDNKLDDEADLGDDFRALDKGKTGGVTVRWILILHFLRVVEMDLVLPFNRAWRQVSKLRFLAKKLSYPMRVCWS
jgi:hypothetical protein